MSGGRSIPEKVGVQCPHCGNSQLESAYAKSTYCRKCSRHFDIGQPTERSSPEPNPAGSFFKRFTKLVSGQKDRSIYCFGCKTPQIVSSSAKSSLCANCGAYIDLRDFKISTSFSRVIQTQGAVIVTSRGDLTSNRVVCGSAVIEGKLHGNVSCSGTITFKTKGRIFGGIETAQLVVAKGADIECLRPLKVEQVEVRGKISARIIADSVTIYKSGWLDGTVYAKTIRVDKGGQFHGELVIGQREMAQPELIPSGAETTPILHPGETTSMLDLGL